MFPSRFSFTARVRALATTRPLAALPGRRDTGRAATRTWKFWIIFRRYASPGRQKRWSCVEDFTRGVSIGGEGGRPADHMRRITRESFWKLLPEQAPPWSSDFECATTTTTTTATRSATTATRLGSAPGRRGRRSGGRARRSRGRGARRRRRQGSPPLPQGRHFWGLFVTTRLRG